MTTIRVKRRIIFTSMKKLIIFKLNKFFNLQSFYYNNTSINYKSIDAFNPSIKYNNDKNNKIRENIIGAIINNKVPDDYFIIKKWLNIKKAILSFIQNLTNKSYQNIKCIHKAGRKYNYDYLLSVLYQDNTEDMFKIEFKFNSSSIKQTPQFNSPMKPSQYMNNSYEMYFYDNYLPLLSYNSNLLIPSKKDYIKQIHNNKPICMKEYQNLYYNGCKSSSQFSNKKEHIAFYNLSKHLSNKSITEFITITELNIDLLSQYLYKTQQNKNYMLYKNGIFILQKTIMNDYIIEKYEKNPNKFRYDCISKSGKQIKVLLRWKNGNGIAFPAFQIS